ncbi:MAG: RNB domain-containing ribonuclease, partial [Thermoplasmata archaeon]|nr:RNB domain-containing ribonuclease [Thermoplasmata archaeon]
MVQAEEERNLLRSLANTLIPRYEEGEMQEAEGDLFSPGAVMKRLSSLKGEKREVLERIINWAEHYIENATWGEDFHISPAPIRRMEDFDLEDFLLKMLWRLFSGKGMSLVSALTELMLLSGRWGVKDAVDALMKYHTRSGRFHFPLEHTPQERLEAETILKRFQSEELSGRRDLTGLVTYTIDPPDAKDFDDAVSIVEMGGSYRVFVHIADVSY